MFIKMNMLNKIKTVFQLEGYSSTDLSFDLNVYMDNIVKDSCMLKIDF